MAKILVNHSYDQFGGEILASKPFEIGGCDYKCTSQLVKAGRGSAIKVFCARANKACTPFGFGEKKQKTMNLLEQIKFHGGIAPYKDGSLAEEYSDIPLGLRNKKGLTIDEMAQALGMKSEFELLRAVSAFRKPKEEMEIMEEMKEFYESRA